MSKSIVKIAMLTHIMALLPEGEHYDAETESPEGAWLSGNHLDAIENALAQNTSSADALNTQVNDLTASVESISGQLQSAQSDLQNAQAELGHKDAEILKLNEQIAELKKAPAGGFSNTSKDEDGGGASDPKEKYRNSEWSKYAAGFFS